MAVFKMSKDFNDIQEPRLMPEDWYLMRVSKEPTQDPNTAMREGGTEADNAGYSIVVNLRAEVDDPEFNGRGFRFYLSLPNATDEGLYVNGQPKADWKEELIAKVTAVFHGYQASQWKELPGDEAEISEGMKAEFYVTQELSRDGQRTINAINVLNNLPQPA